MNCKLCDFGSATRFCHNTASETVGRAAKRRRNLVRRGSNGRRFSDIILPSVNDAKETGSQTFSKVGTPLYLAPEIINHTVYSPATDVYAYGILFWTLFSHKQPYGFHRGPTIALLKAVCSPEEPLRPAIEPDCCWGRRNTTLMQRCWDPDPTCRPTFTEILVILRTENELAI